MVQPENRIEGRVVTMTKRTLGAVVKEARDGARMTQRELATAVGIKASHVAYIENGRRRPSIALINRLSKTLGLDAKELLVLAHPEAKQIVDAARPSTKKGDGAWQQFVSNQALLRRHAITKGELKILKQVAMHENVAHPGHFIFILNAIRQAAAQL
jgi:transcriptional regulator with XRE-family HTH domain